MTTGPLPVHRPVAFRRPADYIHGERGPVVIMSGRVAAWLMRHADLGRLRVANHGVDPEVDATLVAFDRRRAQVARFPNR